MTAPIAQAVSVLRSGGLVAFPTETVYGLGADARNAVAVRRVFAVKGRPLTNPLIVHVADEAVARRYAARWSEPAAKLAKRFWPGPLTLVVPKAKTIVAEATAGLGTVGLRAPDHPLALQLLNEFDGPLVGPSANRSTRISPTMAEHVRRELGDAVDLILDGGPCRVGIESTVLDLSGERPAILRLGAISRAEIESHIGPVELRTAAGGPDIPAASPGQQAVHYAPSAPAYRFERTTSDRVAQWCREHPRQRASVLFVGGIPVDHPTRRSLSAMHELVEMPDDPAAYAKWLYATLHSADARSPAAIWIEMPPDDPPWAAVRDRLMRATTGGCRPVGRL